MQDRLQLAERCGIAEYSPSQGAWIERPESLLDGAARLTVTAQGTGLTIWAASITADTPNVALNVVKLD